MDKKTKTNGQKICGAHHRSLVFVCATCVTALCIECLVAHQPNHKPRHVGVDTQPLDSPREIATSQFKNGELANLKFVRKCTDLCEVGGRFIYSIGRDAETARSVSMRYSIAGKKWHLLPQRTRINVGMLCCFCQQHLYVVDWTSSLAGNSYAVCIGNWLASVFNGTALLLAEVLDTRRCTEDKHNVLLVQ